MDYWVPGGGLRCPIGSMAQLMGPLIICKAVQVILRVQWVSGGCQGAVGYLLMIHKAYMPVYK